MKIQSTKHLNGPFTHQEIHLADGNMFNSTNKEMSIKGTERSTFCVLTIRKPLLVVVGGRYWTHNRHYLTDFTVEGRQDQKTDPIMWKNQIGNKVRWLLDLWKKDKQLQNSRIFSYFIMVMLMGMITYLGSLSHWTEKEEMLEEHPFKSVRKGAISVF